MQGEIPRSGRSAPAVTTALAGGWPWLRTCVRTLHPSECEHSIATTTAAPLAPWFALDIGLELTVSRAPSWAGSSQGYPTGNVQLQLTSQLNSKRAVHLSRLQTQSSHKSFSCTFRVSSEGFSQQTQLSASSLSAPPEGIRQALARKKRNTCIEFVVRNRHLEGKLHFPQSLAECRD